MHTSSGLGSDNGTGLASLLRVPTTRMTAVNAVATELGVATASVDQMYRPAR